MKTTTASNSSAGDILRQFVVILTTLFALGANMAANLVPINGRNTGQISDSFNVLFVPAGYVFSIWGVIYIGIAAYTFYQALPAQRANPRMRASGWLFALGSLANGAWIFAWHYGLYPLTLAIMLVLLGALIAAYLRLDIGRSPFEAREKWTVAVPISVYLGWITVATIANVTAVLGDLGYGGAPFGPLGWTLILLAAGTGIAAWMAFTRADIGYLLVLAWAFAGISVRWAELPVLNAAGYAAAVLVLVLLALGKLRSMTRPAFTRPSRGEA